MDLQANPAYGMPADSSSTEAGEETYAIVASALGGAFEVPYAAPEAWGDGVYATAQDAGLDTYGPMSPAGAAQALAPNSYAGYDASAGEAGGQVGDEYLVVAGGGEVGAGDDGPPLPTKGSGGGRDAAGDDAVTPRPRSSAYINDPYGLAGGGGTMQTDAAACEYLSVVGAEPEDCAAGAATQGTAF